MSEDFLSQEEIDALLGEKKEEKEEEKIAPLDFSKLEHVKKGGVPGLDLLFEKWLKIYGEEIRRLIPQVAMVSKETVFITRFQSFMSKIPMPASYSIASMKPLKENFLLVLDSRLVFVIISVLFGGPAKPFKVEGREFTRLELKIIRSLVELTLETFESVWENIYPVELELKGIELNPTLARIASGNEKVIVVECSMDIEGYEAPFFFCFPQSMFMPIRDIIFSESLLTEKDPIWDAQLRKKVLKTKVKLTLELARKKLRMGDILNWKVEDKINLDVSKKDLVRLYVEETPKFLVRLGKVKDKYAALISKFISGDENGRRGKESGRDSRTEGENTGGEAKG
jgi:flagellar motor switch protein FliM